ncbi:MAG TPA: glutathione S-transferase family protein [Fimbriimonas sp.]|nr:glutathione S-transferase family protein [Fimbriimonas sp.]
MSLTNVEADPELIRLYFSPGTRAVRVRWILEEIGVPYQLSVVSLWRGAHKSKDYLKIHPLGKVPALEIDDTIVFESLGICLYLADRFVDADLAPLVTDKKRRADYCTWMAFSAGTLEPSIFEQLRAKNAKERGVASIGLGPALTSFDNIASYMEHHLAERPFLLGDRMTAADIMNGSMMAWAQDIGLLEGRQSIQAWVANLKTRPAYSRAMQSTGWGWKR